MIAPDAVRVERHRYQYVKDVLAQIADHHLRCHGQGGVVVQPSHSGQSCSEYLAEQASSALRSLGEWDEWCDYFDPVTGKERS